MIQHWHSRLLAVAPLYLLAMISLLATIPLSSAQENPIPVFVHANCSGTASATVLGSLKEQIGTSAKYIVVPKLDDNGRMDEVLEIYVHCTERNSLVAVATSYGKGRCVELHKCGSMIDGSSIRSTLCDGSATAECGRQLYKAFDDYASGSKPGSAR